MPDIHKCAICGNDYIKIRENHKTCSRKCAARLWYASKKKPKESWFGECRNCGETFESTRSGGNPQYFCSKKCAYQHSHKKTTEPKSISHKCNHCGIEFTYEFSGHYRIYCSDTCKIRSGRRNEQLRVLSLKKGVKSKCPMCGIEHIKEVNYTGKGTPRFYCYSCLKVKDHHADEYSERTAVI